MDTTSRRAQTLRVPNTQRSWYITDQDECPSCHPPSSINHQPSIIQLAPSSTTFNHQTHLQTCASSSPWSPSWPPPPGPSATVKPAAPVAAPTTKRAGAWLRGSSKLLAPRGRRVAARPAIGEIVFRDKRYQSPQNLFSARVCLRYLTGRYRRARTRWRV